MGQSAVPASVASHSPGGLKVLGTVSDGAYETVLQGCHVTDSGADTPAHARLESAKKLADKLKEMANTPLEVPRLLAIWRILVGSLNEALSYDVCIIPPSLMAPLANQLDDIVSELLALIAGTGWSQTQDDLCRLDRQCGGCGVPSCTTRAYTAFLASVLRCPPIHKDAQSVRAGAGLIGHVAESLGWLQQKGIWIDDWGMPHKSRPSASMRPESMPAVSLPQRQRAWRTMLAQLEAERLAVKVPLLSSRMGLEGGAFLTATPAEVGTTMTDPTFRTSLRFRLDMPVCGREVCAHRAAGRNSSGKICGEFMNSNGHHAVLCKLGGGVTPVHDACCGRLYAAARASGLRALREQVIPELREPKRAEPRVDLETWGIASEPRGLFDFTICAPFATRYATGAEAVEAGEARKRNEYPAVGGLHVQGIAADVYGRIGPALTNTLTKWADMARQRDISRGLSPKRWLHLWRTQLSVEIATGVSRLIVTADFDTAPSAQHWKPVPPIGRTGLMVDSSAIVQEKAEAKDSSQNASSTSQPQVCESELCEAAPFAASPAALSFDGCAIAECEEEEEEAARFLHASPTMPA